MVAGWRRARHRRLRSSILFVSPPHLSPSLTVSLQRKPKTVSCASCFSSKFLNCELLSSVLSLIQVVVLHSLPSSCKMMTSFFTVTQNSMQKKKAKPNLRPCVSRNKSLEETSIAAQYSREPPCPRTQVASLSDLRAAEKCSKPDGSGGPHAGGTKPKTHRTPDRSGSSSDDAVFQPHKGRVRHKGKLPDAESSKSAMARPPYSQSSSSELEASVIDTRIGRVQGNFKSRNSRSRPNYPTHIKSSSSSLSGPTSKPKIHSTKASQPRPKSPSAPTRNIPPLRRSSSSFHVQKDLMVDDPKDNLRNQSQNTEVMGVNKTFSTIENEVFLRKVEEVLSEIVEQKKRKILDTQKSYSTLKPSSSCRSRERKSSPKSNETWVLSKHFDTSDHTHTFSHIITSHGKGRLRTRSKSSDLLETHEKCFTKLEPYKPRILRKEPSCKLLKEKSSAPNKEPIPSVKMLSAKPKQLLGPVRTESPHTDEQKSSTIEENLTNTTNNTEAEDTCYESENGGSECGLEVNVEALSPSKLPLADQADASVDSAYTGSRGPTPDRPDRLRVRSLQHKLHHREKHLQHKKKIENEKVKKNNEDEVKEKLNVSESLVDKVKHEILQEIKTVGIRSDYAVTALIDIYKRKYLEIPRKKFDLISRDIKFKLGLIDGSFSDNKDSDQEIRIESPKKARVKFLESTKAPESALRVIGTNDLQESKKSEDVLPKEAVQLQEVLGKSRAAADSVRWLSEDEILEAKWASQILHECGIGDQSAKILENAKTWEEVAQALGFTSPFFNTVECGHEDVKECEKHCVPNLYGLSSLDILQSDTEFLPSNTGNDSVDCKEALKALSAHSRRLSSDLSSTKANKMSEATLPPGNLQEGSSPRSSIVPDYQSRLASATLAGASSYSQSSQETVINLKCGRSDSDEDKAEPEAPQIKPDVDSSSENLAQLITEKGNQRIRMSDDEIDDPCKVQLNVTDSTAINKPAPHSLSPDQLESDDDFFDSPAKLKKNTAENDALKELQDANEAKRHADSVHLATETNLKCALKSHINTEELSIEPKDSSSPFVASPTESCVQISSALKPNSMMPAIVSDNLIPTTNEETRNQPVNGKLEIVQSEESNSRDLPSDNKSDSPSKRKETSAPTSSLEFTDKLVNNLSPTEIEEVYSPVSEDNFASEDPCAKFSSEGASNSLGARRSIPNTENHSSSPVKNGKGVGLRQLSLLSRDLSGSGKEVRAAASPTQPSLEGKITALAAAYSSQAEEQPEWLVLADDVCKQFDISL